MPSRLTARRVVSGLWRVGRAVSHVLLGMLICAVCFPWLGTVRRMQCVRWWSGGLLRKLGVALAVDGTPIEGPVLRVANHVSWLDIMALNAVAPGRFVAKSEIRAWPLLGWLAACGGTLFIERSRMRDARRIAHGIAGALQRGEVVSLFPEGTTSDGRVTLHFHAGLLQAAIAANAPLQPVALHYRDDDGAHSARAAYVGEMALWTSLWRVVTAPGLRAEVRFLPGIASVGADRHGLAKTARQMVDQVLPRI